MEDVRVNSDGDANDVGEDVKDVKEDQSEDEKHLLRMVMSQCALNFRSSLILVL